MLGIAIHCIQHSQAMLEHWVCELAHSFCQFSLKIIYIFFWTEFGRIGDEQWECCYNSVLRQSAFLHPENSPDHSFHPQSGEFIIV